MQGFKKQDQSSENIVRRSSWLWYSSPMLSLATKRMSSPTNSKSTSTTTIIKSTTIASGAGRNS
jgi:hypothetical protein